MRSYVIGIDEVGRAASKRRASRLACRESKRAPRSFVIGIDEVGRAASKRRASPRYIIGIDEVGRGSLAGPVTVAAVALPRGLRVRHPLLGGIRDSKRLTPRQREAWYGHLMGRLIVPFAVTHGPTATVDRVNVSQAANRAALRAFQAVAARLPHDTSPRRVYLDGGLYLGTRGGAAPRHVVARTVVCGDERFTVVAAASIVAKVRRDRLMRRLAGRHPGYGFEVHKGYGTPQHLRALRRFGPSPSHRLTFLGFLKDFKRLRRNLSRKH